MDTVGLRELRHNAAALVRRVEAGGQAMEITVSGRPAARLVPITPRRWQRWEDIADAFAGRRSRLAERPGHARPSPTNRRG